MNRGSAPPCRGKPGRPLQVDEAASLTVSAADAGANAAVVIGRLAAGSTLSAGTQVAPNTWRLSVEELKRAVIAPPRGFVGVMAVSLELRLADDSVADRKNLELEWLGKNAIAPAAISTARCRRNRRDDQVRRRTHGK
jgi:hypothetical protein